MWSAGRLDQRSPLTGHASLIRVPRRSVSDQKFSLRSYNIGDDRLKAWFFNGNDRNGLNTYQHAKKQDKTDKVLQKVTTDMPESRPKSLSK